ncbi:Calx-beta domain-containing protein [Mycolicibacterium sp. CH28]|uniref:Calx-beta domain-containing protein n=1 Tax=Mycolicibacterium sp. CH28 TaxID=2512237 RepID=UPI001386821E|nr:Calx-beta domain-containing protein [Mycolicibacterium sp. CH28]
MSSTAFGFRIGSAAFAMGLGLAVASSPGIAVADNSDTGGASQSSNPSGASGANNTSGASGANGSAPQTRSVGTSRRSTPARSGSAAAGAKKRAGTTSATRPDSRPSASDATPSATAGAENAPVPAGTASAGATNPAAAEQASDPSGAIASLTQAVAPQQSVLTPAHQAAAVAARPTNIVSGFLSLLGLNLSGAGTGLPPSPVQFLTGALALVRREIESFVKRLSALLPTQATQGLTAGAGVASATTGTTTTITWAWGSNPVLAFNPATDKLDFGWMQSSQFTVTEKAGSVQIGIVDNNHTYTLQGVTLGQLQMSNIVAKDAGTVAKWQSLISNAQTALPSVSVGDTTVAEGNSGTTNAAFTVTLSKASTKPVTVTYTTSNGTATAGQDYVAGSGTVTFAAGVTSQTVNVGVLGDTTFEPNETFTVTLSNASGATVSRATATGTITNDDAAPVTPPTVSISNASVAEGNSGNSNMAFTVTLSKASTSTVTLSYTTANGTATAGQDYVASAGTVTFAPGVVSQVINVGVTGDTTVEPTETFTVTLSNPTGATIAVASATGTITNDDTATTPGGTAQWGTSFFAPYVDMGAWPVPNLLALSKTYGTSLMTLGFMQADQNGNLAWAGLAALEPSSTNEQAVAINTSIATFKAAGGDVMISFGGASGTSIAQAYAAKGKSAQDLANAYAAVIDTYGITHIDFDIEGAAVADPASIALNSQALALLQKAKPEVQIWYTLPVLPTGLTADGVNVVDAAVKAGVKLDGVNVMAMDYGESAAPTSGAGAQTMGAYAIQSAQSTYTQLSSLYTKYGKTFAWSQIGVTPMLGVNDIVSEVFTVADAQALEDFARTKGIGMLSMWQVLRDTPGTLGQASTGASGLSDPVGSFSTVFNDYGTVNVVNYGSSGGSGTGGSGTGGGSTGGGTPVTGGSTTTITWGWGTNPVLSFNPAKDTLDFVWMQPAEFDVTEQSGSVVISVVGNNHTYTLQGVSLSQLQPGNIIAKDSATLAKWQSILAAAKAA